MIFTRSLVVLWIKVWLEEFSVDPLSMPRYSSQ
jgi:hypothetical protein